MLKHKGTLTIETERLILRRFTLSDAEDMFNNWADDEQVALYMRWDAYKSTEQVNEYIIKLIESYDNQNTYRWAIELKSEKRAIGAIGFHVSSDYDMCADVSYCLGRIYWGKGIVTEALKAVLHYGLFDVGLNRIEAFHAINNAASGKVMQKADMFFEGLSRQAYRSHLGFEDSNTYGIIKQDLFNEIIDFNFLDTDYITDGEIELVCIEKFNANYEINYVPSYSFNIKKSNKRVGEINLRIGFNENIYYGGHIGYSVDEAYRCNGYATRACNLLKPFALIHGLKHLLITTNPENTASRRVCEKIGANLIRIVDIPEHNEMYLEGERRKCIYQWNLDR